MTQLTATQQANGDVSVGDQHSGHEDMSDENRRHDRHEITTDGQIRLQNGFKIPIRVLDISRTGAKLKMDRYVVLPTEFDVEIYSPDGTKLKITSSKRQWQKQNECGVKFLSSRTEVVG